MVCFTSWIIGELPNNYVVFFYLYMCFVCLNDFLLDEDEDEDDEEDFEDDDEWEDWSIYYIYIFKVKY